MTPAELRKARYAVNLSQAELGKALGYGGAAGARGQQVYKMEAGRKPIREPMARLVEMFVRHGVPPEYLA